MAVRGKTVRSHGAGVHAADLYQGGLDLHVAGTVAARLLITVVHAPEVDPAVGRNTEVPPVIVGGDHVQINLGQGHVGDVLDGQHPRAGLLR